MNRRILFSAALISLTVACGGAEEEDIYGEVCEHLEEGPSEAVTSTATADGAPEVADNHTRYDIALTDGAGFVSFNADEGGEFIFGGDDSSFDLTITDSTGAEVEIEETVAEPCEFASSALVADLEVGSYTIEVSASSDLLGLIIEHGGEHEDHDH